MSLKKHTLLLGEGIHQHTLYGKFDVEGNDFAKVSVHEKSILKHEKPNGQFSNEHKALVIEKSLWMMGKQVEINPFKGSIRRILD